MRYASLAIVYVNNPFENDCKSTTFIWNSQFFFSLRQGKRMKFLKITTILTKLPKLLTGVSALD